MKYDLNVEGYKLFIQIEVGVREFLINLIKEQDITNWFLNFLGQTQREELSSIVRRIIESNAKNINPNIEDIYLLKLNRAIKIEASLKSTSLFHPFYYLNWTDLENLIKIKPNSILIDKSLGKQNKNILLEDLNVLTPYRNDVAHSRFVTDRDLKIIRSCFDQISTIIPNFFILNNNQSTEERVDLIYSGCSRCIVEISNNDILDLQTIENIINFLIKSKNSFWLNSIDHQLITLIEQLLKMMIEYKTFRNIPGGLLSIQKLKDNNLTLITKLDNYLRHGEI